MPKIMGTTVVLASVGLLVLGGCASVREFPSASPSITGEPEPQLNGPRDPNEVPQAL